MADESRRQALEAIPADVRAQAEEPLVFSPDPPPESGARRIALDRCVVFTSPMPTVTFVEGIRACEDEVEELVAEVRELLRRLGRSQAAWTIGPSTRPTDLEATLRERGFVDYDEAPLEPIATSMALMHEPPLAHDPAIGIEPVVTIEQLRTAKDVEVSALGLGTVDAAALAANLDALLELQRSGRSRVRQTLATLDGEPVGVGRAMLLEHGINLSGAVVVPAARGRGVYRALVAARWHDAVARGTPALTVQAGRMSQPILARLGFVEVAVSVLLLDRF